MLGWLWMKINHHDDSKAKYANVIFPPLLNTWQWRCSASSMFIASKKKFLNCSLSTECLSKPLCNSTLKSKSLLVSKPDELILIALYSCDIFCKARKWVGCWSCCYRGWILLNEEAFSWFSLSCDIVND